LEEESMKDTENIRVKVRDDYSFYNNGRIFTNGAIVVTSISNFRNQTHKATPCDKSGKPLKYEITEEGEFIFEYQKKMGATTPEPESVIEKQETKKEEEVVEEEEEKEEEETEEDVNKNTDKDVGKDIASNRAITRTKRTKRVNK